MITGLGLDVCELDRIERSWKRFGEKFAARILHPNELALLPSSPVAYLASRFAAKEAAVKALGTGFTGGIWFTQIEVAKEASGKPALRLHGNAAERARELGATTLHISLTHGKGVASAVVILES
ncbi:MAG: holo-[acyl-carrier-protein] synthase [Halodesulfovibrio sp.]